MIRSIRLDTQLTAPQVQVLLGHIEEQLRDLGALVERSPYGALRFRFPPPWRARHLGILHVVTSGRTTMGAAAGEPWRVRYELKFTRLQWLATVLSAAVAAIGIRSGGFVIFYAIVAVWLVFYVAPYSAATLRFRNLVQALVRDITPRVVTGEFR